MNLNEYVDSLDDEYLHSKLKSIKSTVEYIKNLSDDEIVYFNDKYYKFLNNGAELAFAEYEYSPDAFVLFLKFLTFCEIHEKVQKHNKEA